MTTEDSNLEERIESDTTVKLPKQESVAKFSWGMYTYLRKNGLISEDELHWAGYTSDYRGSEHDEQNPDHVTYDNMPAEYHDDN